jgi:hypothetical protein
VERSFVDALLAAPVGAALLAGLEADQRPDRVPFEVPPDSDRVAVAAAVDRVAGLRLEELLALAVWDAQRLVGPWTGGGPSNAALAYRYAAPRRPIAAVLADHFAADLHGALNPRAQQWWYSDRPTVDGITQPTFTSEQGVYGNGEFTFDGLWTATDPAPELTESLVAAWELFPAPIHRWRMPVRAGARVWEVHRPGDWVRLVRAYPSVASRPHGGWELPGPNQHEDDLVELLATPGQHATRTRIGDHVLPNWGAVAADWDGVHLSWAGFLTAEGYVSDLGDSAVTMLRYWSSERTLWLNDVFDDPQSLPH